MKTLWNYEKSVAKIGLFLFVIAFTSCNTLKRVEDDELLLTKNNIFVNSEKVKAEDIKDLLLQEPNSTLLGFPLRLNLYNLAKKDPDSSYQVWLNKKENREEKLANFLSQKQVNRLGESFVVKGYSEWLKKIGEPPSIVDSLITEKSLERLSIYYGSKGYFNNTTSYTIDSTKRKQRAEINYAVALGKPFIIDSISRQIGSASIDSIYRLNEAQSFIQPNKQFDLVDFNNERERLTKLFRNTGVYNFQESSIAYNILRDTSRVNDDQKMNVELSIGNLRKRGDTAITTAKYRVYHFDKINIYADYGFDDDASTLKSVEYDNYTIYYKDKLRYKPKALTSAIFLEKDSLYRDIDKLRTYRQITNLNTFKYPNILFVEDSTQTKLTADIFLATRPKFSWAFDFDITHSNIQTIGIGFSTSLISRNIFRGAETLSLSVGGTFGLLSDDSSTEDFFSEIGADVAITFPRIWFPFVKWEKIIPYYKLPQSRVSVGTSFQRNIGLNKQTFNTILGYNWSTNNLNKNNVELLNIQFVNNLNPDRFYNVYQSTYEQLNDIASDEIYSNDPALEDFYVMPESPDGPQLLIPDGTTGFTNAILDMQVPSAPEDFEDVSSIEERRIRLTENNLIFASNYTFNKNNRTNINDNSFYSFKFKVESAGIILSAISNIITFDKNENGDRTVFNVPFSQYIKTEFDYIKHWDLSRSNVLAFRSFFGIAVPYGNSNSVPFVRSYFGGGSNDNRAWFPYSLGPGKTDNVNDFNEANMKIALNLEYRFPIVGNFKGAIFADAGNIWNVWDNVQNPDAVFEGFESLSEIALGTGFGVRYDFTYFVFRLDVGFKTYNPAEIPSKRWFRDYNFGNAVVQIGINYPF
ncbi:BamA/TamA family outer membrane protein [uncultured Eudoraea sp.]|uniref:translocation and assembly module lipoprotein TamL n=1 Tax=uncultured Eudoraea sp. TaxID=1035614 RepID=UPI002630C11C|nr:BamA/TamA family outer membrane protein [uncultured Eudoraea sp.]